MPKLFGVCRKQHFNLMVRCTSASLAAGVLFLLTQAFDCHILPATEAQAEGRLQRSTMRMDPFSKIVHCAPFNLMISPSPDYKVVVVAEDDVKAAVSAEVHGETLHLDVKQGFRTDKPIQVTIGLPRDKLKSVKNVFPKSDVAVSEGFSVQRFMAQVSGTARMVLRGLDAEEATLRTSG